MKVFISSTQKDLHTYRQAVVEQLLRMRYQPLAMEYFGSNPASPISACKQEIAACNLFIGIYAHRYGYIPADDDRSITEQEYTYARELGKPCLCYFIDPDHRSSDLLIPEPGFEGIIGLLKMFWMRYTGRTTPQEKLESFKKRIASELVISPFTTHHHLVASLNADLNRIEKDELIGIIPAELLRRWNAWAVERGNRLYSPGSTLYRAESPLMALWRDFSTAPAWHEQISMEARSMIEKITAATGELSRLTIPENDALRAVFQTAIEMADQIREVIVAVGPINFSQNYHSIATTLEQVCNDMTLRSVKESFGKLERSSHNLEMSYARDPFVYPIVFELKRAVEKIDDVVKRWEVLVQKVKKPAFQKIFAIMGRSGAGKTHFIADLMTGANDRQCYLFLNLPGGQSELEPLLLDAARRASQFDWRSFNQFRGFLDQQKVRVFVVIDDVQRWLQTSPHFIEHIQEYISGHTALHSLFWLITLEDSSYDVLRATNAFWSEYTYQSDGAFQTPSGWVALNDVNERTKFGLDILRAASAQDSAIKVNLSVLEAGASPQLSTPFIARIVIDLLRHNVIPAVEVVNLNYIEFVQHYRQQMQERMPLEGLSLLEMKQAIIIVADLIPRVPPKTPRERWVQQLRRFAELKGSNLREQVKAEAAIDILLREHLLDSESSGGESMDAFPTEILRVGFATFWQYYIAYQRQPQITDDQPIQGTTSKGDLDVWFRKVRDPSLNEGILEFLFLLLDQVDQSENTGFQHTGTLIALMRQSLRDLGAALWFAGAKASVPFQRALAQLGADAFFEPSDQRSLFAGIYFVANAEPSIRLDDRLRLLQPYYAQIRHANHIEYFCYAVKRLLGLNYTGEEIAAGMVYLGGTEQLGGSIAQELAILCMQVLKERALTMAAPAETERAMLLRLRDWIMRYTELCAANRVEQEERPWRRTRYREWVLYEFCNTLVASLGCHCYYLLAEAGWFADSSQQQIRKDKQREATIALGTYFRRLPHGAKDSQRYIEIVDALRTGTDIDKEVAFFLILQSVPKERRRAERIDQRLCPALTRLSQEPSLAWLMRVGEFAAFINTQLGRCESEN